MICTKKIDAIYKFVATFIDIFFTVYLFMQYPRK